MFIPYNTDAPIYHVPYATIGLIVINSILFLAVPEELKSTDVPVPDAFLAGLMDEEPDNAGPKFDAADFADPDAENGQIDDFDFVPGEDGMLLVEAPWNTLALEYGRGLKPWQWTTSIFMHADIMHLIGNMIFLWAFGLVVEGKVGPLIFLLLYLGIGVSQSGVEQVLMYFAQGGGSVGASAAIFGLLGIAMIWAPSNGFDVFWTFGFRFGTIEIPIMVFGFIQFAFEFIGVAISGGTMSSSVLHLMGFAIGLGAGFVWLARGWVDCEGWDIIHVWKGDEGGRRQHEQRDDEADALVRRTFSGRRSETPKPVGKRQPSFSSENHKFNTADDPDQLASNLFGEADAKSTADETVTAANLDEFVLQRCNEQQYDVALKLIANREKETGASDLSQPILAALIRGLLSQKALDKAAPLMEEHARRFSVGRVSMLLNLAKSLLHLERPKRAQRALRAARDLEMDDKAKRQWKALVAHSKKMIDEGTIELSE